MTDAERARRLLERARTRGEIRALAPELDQDPALRRAVIDEGRARGVELPDDALDWPAKRLLRVARGREAAARTRANPIRRDEAFTCAHCGRDVPPHGRTARDHCPWCLRSLHVDVVPGDRAESCHGLLDPSGFELVNGLPVIRHRCRRCGAERRVRAITDGALPDDWDALVALSSGVG